MIDIDDFNKFTKAKMKVENYISKMGYTYTVKSLVDMYKNYYCKGYYISFTQEDCVKKIGSELKFLSQFKCFD